MAGNVPRGSLSHIADAQGKKYPLEGHFPGFPDTVHKAPGRLFLPAFQHQQLRLPERIKIGRGMHQVQVVQLLHGGFSGQDIHGFAGQEMNEASLDLGRASLRIGAEPAGFSLRFHQGSAAVRTNGREGRTGRPGGTPGHIYACNLGNNLSALFHIHPVSLVNVQAADLVLIDQRGPLDHGAAQQHRFHIGNGGDGTGTPHLVINGQDGGAGLFRLELIRNGPPGTLGRVAQRVLTSQFIDFDHNAVCRIRKVLPGLVPMVDESFYLLDRVADLPLVRHREAPGGGCGQRLVVRGIIHLADRDVVQGTEEAAPAHFLRVLQLERTAGGIAGIGKKGILVEFPFMVQPFKRFIGHQDLSADFEFIRIAASFQDVRNRSDPAGVFGDIVSHHAVSASQRAEKLAMAVGEADGRAVELEFTAVGKTPVQRLGCPLGEFFHFFHGIGVAQRQHGILVRILGEAGF